MISQAKHQTAMESMSALAKKVYAHTPLQEAWALNQIVSDMRRSGVNVSINVDTACISALRDAGLVRSMGGLTYTREAIKARPAEPNTTQQEDDEEAMTMTTPAKAAQPEQKAPLEMFSTLAGRARDLAANLKALAGEIETAALHAEEVLQGKDNDLAKMNQLKLLLKSIGD